jgi:hypothetical protein
MKRRVFIVGTAATAVAAGSGPASGQQNTWVDVTSPDGRYRLKMPNGYRYIQAAAHGGVVHTYAVMLPDRFVFELIDAVVPSARPVPTGPDLAAALEQMQGGMMKSWPGSTVLEQRPVTTGPLTGREFVLSAEGGSRVVIVRLYMNQGAVYSQVAQGPAAERSNPMIAQFMDSLQFG